MPALDSIFTALPEYPLTQADAATFALGHFASGVSRVERFRDVFANTGIERRYLARPLDWLSRPRDFAETNEAYIDTATVLCSRAIRELLDSSGISPERLGLILYVNSTGLATPSIDARLIHAVGVPPTIKRLPVWGLGCAGGVAALGHAHEFLLGHPDQAVLVVACELCSLTFLPGDFSKSNIIASALFGDGAAAALMLGDDLVTAGHRIRPIRARSRLVPDSLAVMGWHVRSSGLQVIFAERIPELVLQYAAGELAALCQEAGISREAIGQYALHPGGTKVLAAYEQALGLPLCALSHSRQVLKNFGNMSSVTALFVLDALMKSQPATGYALSAALGPGFSAESVLFEIR